MRGLDSYRKLSQEVYDLSKPEPADFVWEFYLNHAQSVEGPILEPMCGSGRFLVKTKYSSPNRKQYGNTSIRYP